MTIAALTPERYAGSQPDADLDSGSNCHLNLHAVTDNCAQHHANSKRNANCDRCADNHADANRDSDSAAAGNTGRTETKEGRRLKCVPFLTPPGLS